MDEQGVLKKEMERVCGIYKRWKQGQATWGEYQETQGLSGAGPDEGLGSQEVLLQICERKGDQGKCEAGVLG